MVSPVIKLSASRISGAEPPYPFLDIAGFARGVFGAMAVEYSGRARDLLPEPEETLFLGDPDRGVGRVAQNKPVEICAVSGFLHRFINRAQSRQHPIRVLVVSRQQHRSPAANRRKGCGGNDAEFVVLPEQQHGKARKRGHEGKCDPCEQQHEQPKDDRFQDRDATDLENAVHLITACRGQNGSAGQDEGSPRPHRCKAEGRRRRKPPQRLDRHVHRRFRRQERARWNTAALGRSTDFR
jgi:hypothetical protein